MATESPSPALEHFPDPRRDIVKIGGDLEPDSILEAYRAATFPMRIRTGELAWWSPDPRGIITAGRLRITNSLKRSLKRYEIRVDTSFAAVIEACARRSEPGMWIDDDIESAFIHLHELGWVHSVETWKSTEDGKAVLVGGLYGVAIGGLFCGESMFHRERDASKAALVALCEIVFDAPSPDQRLIDVQWLTPHLASMGATTVTRSEYQEMVKVAQQLPLPESFFPATPSVQ